MYLKCKYGEGMFPNERWISFNGDGQNWCFVNKEDVVTRGGKEGFVKLRWHQFKGDEAYVGINDTGDHRVSTFKVPKEDVLEEIVNTSID